MILYTSVGLGHKYIALNIAYHLKRAGFEVQCFDVLQLQEGVMVNLGKRLHAFVNIYTPFIWRWLYLSKLFAKITLPLRVPLAGWNYGHIKRQVADFKPDMIISTQTSASAPIAYMKRQGEFNGKFLIAFSDYHLHQYWLYPETDGYLANIDEQKQELTALGVPAEIVNVCGITLPPAKDVNKSQVRSRYEILETDKVVLLASGSLGTGFTADFVKEYVTLLLEPEGHVKVIVVCGKNKELKQALEALAMRGVIVLGFHETMHELYSISDAFLTKPGGLTIAEALQYNCRIVIFHWLPGQEELNYNYLVSKKIIESMPHNNSVQSLVESTMAALGRETPGETPESLMITQKHHEGMVLINAVNSVFHNV